MILAIHDFLTERIATIFDIRIRVWQTILMTYWWMYARLKGIDWYVLWFQIPFIILTSGMLVNPYLKGYNAATCYLNRKIFKRKFVRESSEGKWHFTNKKEKGWFSSIVGIVYGSVIYLDSTYKERCRRPKYARGYEIIAIEGLREWIGANELESQEEIDKKMVALRLVGVTG